MNFEIDKGPEGQTVLSLRPQTDVEVGLVQGLIPTTDPPTQIVVRRVDEKTNKIEIVRLLTPVAVAATPIPQPVDSAVADTGAVVGENNGVVSEKEIKKKYKAMTREQLMTHLAENGISYETDANKDTLVNLAVAAETTPKE